MHPQTPQGGTFGLSSGMGSAPVGNQPASAPSQSVGISSAQISTPVTPSSKPGGTDGKISNDTVTRPGQYYSDYPFTSIKTLAESPGTAAQKWSKFYGRGGNAYANYMSEILKDPMAMLKTMGVNAGSLNDPQDVLDWQRRLWDIASGRDRMAGGQFGYFSGRDIVQNVLNAKYNVADPAGSLGGMLNNPDLTPDQQVSNTIQLLLGSLQGVVNSDALQAYQATLGKIGQEFIDMKMKDPTKWASLPFNEYAKQRLGQGGGLY